MHTDPTLKILEEATISIGAAFRKFTDQTCPAFDTRELRREEDVRNRRAEKEKDKARKEQAQGPNSSLNPPGLPPKESHSSVETTTAITSALRKKKQFNLQRYKYHALGDYVETIRRYGTTDSYSTEPVSALHIIEIDYTKLWYVQGELEHRKLKARYKRTDKNKYTQQLARMERREARLRRIRARLSSNPQCDEKVALSPHEHHHIGVSQNRYEHIGLFLKKTAGDPATKVSIAAQVKEILVTFFYPCIRIFCPS